MKLKVALRPCEARPATPQSQAALRAARIALIAHAVGATDEEMIVIMSAVKAVNERS